MTSPESDRLAKEAMADAAKVEVVVTGRNGHRVEININGHERTDLTFGMASEQDQPDVEYWQVAPPPAWRRHTFTVEARFHYRAEDFLALRE